jgi:Holliday junction resolvase RusA-like endonuclease
MDQTTCLDLRSPLAVEPAARNSPRVPEGSARAEAGGRAEGRDASPAPGSGLKLDIAFFVPGEPKGKGRHRSRIAGGKAGRQFVQHYAPKDTVEYENLVRMAAHEAMEGRDPTRHPVAMTMTAFVSVPSSWSKKKQARALNGMVCPTGKPDLDNLEKAILDGMNKIVFADDAQVCRVTKAKLYATTPGVEVYVTEIGADPAR